jgi:hypothetical protein
MKDPLSLFSISAAAALVLGGASATAAELPTFELMGFPITPHQVQVVGAGNVQERSPTSTLTLAGMPASPHQLAVLAPRRKMAEPEERGPDMNLRPIPTAAER